MCVCVCSWSPTEWTIFSGVNGSPSRSCSLILSNRKRENLKTKYGAERLQLPGKANTMNTCPIKSAVSMCENIRELWGIDIGSAQLRLDAVGSTLRYRKSLGVSIPPCQTNPNVSFSVLWEFLTCHSYQLISYGMFWHVIRQNINWYCDVWHVYK